MSHDIIGNISFNQDIVNTMGCDGSVEGMMDGTVSDVRSVHATTQVEMKSISPQPEGLSHVPKFSVFNSAQGTRILNDESAYMCMDVCGRVCVWCMKMFVCLQMLILLANLIGVG